MKIPGLRPGRNAKSIPPDTKCQEASILSHESYIPCCAPAVAVVDNGDSKPYFMCEPCAWHNCRNRGGKLIFTTSEKLNEQFSAT